MPALSSYELVEWNLKKTIQYYCTPWMCSIWKHASTERVLSLRFFQEAQRDCKRSIQSVPTASCLQYRPSLVWDTRPGKSPLNARSFSADRWGYDRWWGIDSMCTLSFISLSRICTSCCMEGRWPDSSLDHTGTSFKVISNAPVDIHWFSIMLLRKKTIIQA